MAAVLCPQMGLQSGATHVALWLMTLSAFALAQGALSMAITIGEAGEGVPHGISPAS